MKLHAFAIYDSAAESFGRPFFLNAPGEAARDFADGVNTQNDQNNVWRHPDDYTLFQIGEYETDTGKMTAIEPKQIMRGKDVKIRDTATAIPTTTN